MITSSESTRTGLEIAVIGMDGVFPGADSVDAFWSNLADGVESITFFSDDDLRAAGIPDDVFGRPEYVPARGVLTPERVEGFDAALFGMSPREAQILDPQQRVFLECCWAALEAAGYNPKSGLEAGVYGSTSPSTYLWANLSTRPDVVDAVGLYQVGLANRSGLLPTRVSYKLDLTGPSVNVQTACSSSLVALHTACQSLLSGECEMALAGGVSIQIPHHAGYAYEDGGIMSPDGHCRPFDADAAGTTGGCGCGVVVLKCLDDALADGDAVRAVVLGSAVNNDGARKIGFTAPSARSQTRVIEQAHRVAGVHPRSIGYVEAHGTGTTLGDPIEIEGLTDAFRPHTADRGFCAIGSVKSNVGHLDTAAGIAGVIKTVLALEHRQIPPSLNFTAPNPATQLDASPFYVNDGLRDWPDVDGPRRAGVSSFGIGGTNAHVVLEEALPVSAPPAPDASNETDRPAHLFVVSAQSASARDASAQRLAGHLDAHPASPLADVAYTLQVGRHPMPHRGAVVATTAADASERLRSRGGDDPAKALHAGTVQAGAPPVAFLFPGQGAQYPNAARGLYERFDAVRDAVDACATTLLPHLGFDLRALLFPKKGQEERAAARLQQTSITQPALFTVEYALAQLWTAWGVRPDAMIGHSVGEYVAACLAGVFTLDQALDLTAARGRMMQDLPGGSMLAVSCPEADVVDRLDAQSAVAAVNHPAKCVVAGPNASMTALADALAADGIATKRLHTSHAFHSPMMEPIRDAFAEQVRRMDPQPPSQRFVSTTTGTWIRPEQATDPAYWARHLRAPVRFADAVATLLDDTDRVLLEVGPGRTLATLATRHPARDGQTVVASTRHPKADARDDAVLLSAVARLWTRGVPVDWTALHRGASRRRVPLPTYPFERRRYWIDAHPDAYRTGAAQGNGGTGQLDGFNDGLGGRFGVEAGGDGAAVPVLDPSDVPQGDTEAAVAEVWEHLLGITPVGRDTGFFDAGGDSLIATRVVSHLRDRFAVDLPIDALFGSATVASVAKDIDALQTSRADTDVAVDATPDVPRVSRERPLPLSFAQLRLWTVDQITPGLSVYNLPLATRLTGSLDVDVLEASIQAVVDRHEALRTTFGLHNFEPVQVIHDRMPVPLRRVVVQDRDVEDVEAYVRDVLEDERGRPFDLETGPLLRALLVQTSPDEHVLLVTMHHVVSDGWSMSLFVNDVVDGYRQRIAGVEPTPAPLSLQYADVAAWSRERLEAGEMDRQLDYWTDRLRTAPPVCTVPPDRPRPATQTFAGAVQTTTLDRDTVDALRTAARDAGGTLFMALVSVFGVVLRAATGTSDVMIGTDVSGRTHRATESLIGFFVNQLALRLDLSPSTFADLLRHVKEVLVDAYAHQDVPFERVVKAVLPDRSPQHAPLFQVKVVMLNTPDQSRVDGADGDFGATELDLSIEPIDVATDAVQTDVQLVLRETGDGVQARLEYNTDLYDAATATRLLEQFRHAADRAASDASADLDALIDAFIDAPSRPATERDEPGATAADQIAMLSSRREEGRDAPSSTTLLGLVRAQATRTPNAVAVACGDERLTYRALVDGADALARRLRAQGVGPECVVGLCLPRSTTLVTAMLATWAAGGAYLPLDPAFPAARLTYMMDDAGADVVLTDRAGHAELGAAWPGARVVCVDAPAPAPTGSPSSDSEPLPEVDPDALAYLIYTSGSTGRPKGVLISHRAGVCFLRAMLRDGVVGASDRLLAVTTLSFDIALLELIGPLACGGSVHVAPSHAVTDGGRLKALAAHHAATVMQATPVAWRLLLDASGTLPPIRVLCGGEAMPPDLARDLRNAGTDVWNLYGPTEATVWATTRRVLASDATTASGGAVSIGAPIAGYAAYVLNADGAPVDAGTPGDLYVGGAALARGYHARPGLTAERFVPDPFASERGARMYATGDRATWSSDGTLRFLGRLDHQVKVQGHRIELGEIEVALRAAAAVGNAVVVARDGVDAHTRLVAYVVPPDGDAAQADAVEALRSHLPRLRTHLARRLPAYMVPNVIQALDRLPLTPNGKVDRNALPEVRADRSALDAPYEAPRPGEERTMADLWRRVLHVDRVGRNDNFFSLGGDSVLGVQIVARARHAGFDVEPHHVFEHQTVASLCAVAGARNASSPEASSSEDAPATLSAEDADAAARSLASAHADDEADLDELLAALQGDA